MVLDAVEQAAGAALADPQERRSVPMKLKRQAALQSG